MGFYGRRVNLHDIQTIYQFEMVKEYIPKMSAKHLMNVKDPTIKAIMYGSNLPLTIFIFSSSPNGPSFCRIGALANVKNSRIKMIPLLLKFYGHPSQWTVDNFLSILPFFSKVPEVMIKQMNSSVVSYESWVMLGSLVSLPYGPGSLTVHFQWA